MVTCRREQNWGFSKFYFPYMYINVIRLNCNDDLSNETWYQQMKVETIRNFSWCQTLSLKKAQLLITLQFEANFIYSDFNLSKKYFTQRHHIKYMNIHVTSPIFRGHVNCDNFWYSFSKLQVNYDYWRYLLTSLRLYN